jgi:hypothetical protein
VAASQPRPLASLPYLCRDSAPPAAVCHHLPPTAGHDRLLLLTGGDDQALSLTLLHLPDSGGGGGGDSGDGTPPGAVLRLSIPNAHSSAVRAVWLGPLLAPDGAAAASRCSGAPVLAAAAFSVGLDQQVRCWRVRLELGRGKLDADAGQQAGAAGGGGAGGGEHAAGQACYRASSAAAALEVAEAGCRFCQVVEPAALDVVPGAPAGDCGTAGGGVGQHAVLPPGGGGGPQRFLVGVAGRGTEVMEWELHGDG